MTIVNTTKCDGCGQEVEIEYPTKWITVFIGINEGKKKKPENNLDEIHVDSWDCLGRYAMRKAEEQRPAT